MEQNIIKQLEIIEKANIWIKNSLSGEKQNAALRNMVNFRRKLNKKKYALQGNPAAAMYGESQVGKSYLISSLLSEENNPFCIIDENNLAHNFIEEINPPGGGSESTSLISRFSTSYKPVNTRFPIKAILLSPSDLVLMLCDSFYNDIKGIHELILMTEQINKEVEALKIILKDKLQKQSILVEDDILDMQDYFKDYLPKANNLLNSNFFEEVSLLISKTSPTEWNAIFSLLWNKDEKITTLFGTLITEYEKLAFSNTIYLPLESVLYKHGTLLDVKRLKEIYDDPDKIESEYSATTTVLCQEREITFKKSYLCALSAELVFSQPETLVESKPFLKETDLLDFPGARSRLTLPQDKIETKIIPELLLRGKVAYLFNKYSDIEKINILLFCAKHEQPAQRSMPEMLNNWIYKIVGGSPEKRELFIRKSQIPPLFIIGTFFNVNLQYNPQQDKSGDNSSLNYRWNQRFVRTLAAQMINSEIYDWFENWTISNSSFKNIFLLRDFEKSDIVSHIFNGYNENKKELEEVIFPQYPDFKEKLRQSFIENDFVISHFENPKESWDRAASINEDGTKPIIEKLTISANNINPARLEKMRTELIEVSKNIIDELEKYYHNNEKDIELQKAKSIAGNIQFQLNSAFRADGIKRFGQLMKEFMLEEGVVFDLFRKILADIEHQKVKNLDIFSTYRIAVPVIPNDTEDTYFDRMCRHYEKTTEEQKQLFRAELIEKGIDLVELINSNANLIKNNAQQLAEALIDFWLAYVALNDKKTIQEILASDGSPSLQEIADMFQKLFKKLDISNKIAGKIRRYVNVENKSELPFEIVADISAELLNKCINTVGFEYLDAAEIVDLKKANEVNKLGLVIDQTTNNNIESVGELFSKIDNWTEIINSNPEAITSLPSYHNYLLWYNRLKIGFISVCNIPNYDIQANEKMKMIKEQCETIKY